ncbi:MAG: hypothetical protein WED33_00100, partial [Bacteroidia bacterium]
MRFLIVLFLFSISPVVQAQKLIESELYEDSYLPGVVEVKLKAQIAPENDSNLSSLLSKWNCISISKRFPRAKSPEKEFNSRSEKLADISKLYTIKLPESANLQSFLSELIKLDIIEIAELHFLPNLLYVPSDDSVDVQYALNRIQAFAGWDLHQGDTNTVIGITDTGVEIYHPD